MAEDTSGEAPVDALAAALGAIEASQREIDALHARRARELVAVLERALEAEPAPSSSSRSQREEFARRSARAEIALALRVGERTADRLVGEAETLVRAVPGVLAAVEAGRVAWRAASVVAMAAGTLVCDLRGDHVDADAARTALARFEAAAIDLAGRVPPSRLRVRLETVRERIHPVSADRRHATARLERRVELEDLADGMAWLHALLPVVEAHAVMGRLTDVAREARDLDAEEGVDDDRTLDQRRADLLVDFLVGDQVRIGDHGRPGMTIARRTADGRGFARFAGIRPTVVVTVPVQTLLPRSDGLADAAEPSMLDGTVPIDPATARALAGRATTFYRMLVDAHTGARLDLSRRSYRPTAGLRMWLRLRDEHCRFPGCGRPVRGCDIDHTLDWQRGGATRADNLAHLCRGHHTLKHQTKWRVTQGPGGVLSWTAPSGASHDTSPPAALIRSG